MVINSTVHIRFRRFVKKIYIKFRRFSDILNTITHFLIHI